MTAFDMTYYHTIGMTTLICKRLDRMVRAKLRKDGIPVIRLNQPSSETLLLKKDDHTRVLQWIEKRNTMAASIGLWLMSHGRVLTQNFEIYINLDPT